MEMIPPREEDGNEKDRVKPPEDTYNLVYCACVLGGIAFLVPFCSVTLAVDYFQMHYPGGSIMFAISVSYLITVWVGCLLSNLSTEWLNPQIKTLVSYGLSILGLLYFVIIEAWLRPFPLDVSYRLVVLFSILLAFASALMQTNYYGLFSMLPQRYTQGVMMGESTAGTLAVICRILTKAFIADIHTSIIIYFTSSVVLMLVCLVSYILVLKSSLVKYYLDTSCIIEAEAEEAVLLKTNKESGEGNASIEYGSANNSHGVKDICGKKSSSNYELFKVRIKNALHARLDVVKIIWPYMLAFWLDYFVTLGIYPGISSEIISCRLGSWMPVLMLSVFNVCDLVGKIFVKFEYDWPKYCLILCSTARIVLIPLLILCATPRLHPVIEGEALPLLFSILNGLTNGYFGSAPIVLVTTKVSPGKKELAGNIMVLALTTGLAMGSGTSYGYLDIIGPLTSTNNPCLQNVTGPT